MSLLIVGMDNTIVNVALPALRTDLSASLSGLQWTIDAYTVVLASGLVLAGSTADRLGRRRVFQTGLVTFVLGSLLCSLAPSLDWLVAARVLQAVGGCMLNPVAMSIVTNTFTDPRERAQAIGVWGGTVGLSLGLGPVVGGALVDSIGWRSVFWINIPLGLAACVLAALVVPESRAPHARRLDLVGQLLVVAVLAGLTYGIIDFPSGGRAPAVAIGVAVVALLAFVPYELRRREPLIELAFFRSAPFAGATVIAVCAFGAYSGFLFLNTLYLQDARGMTPLAAGLATLPLAVMTVVCAPLSGRWVGRAGPRVPLLVAGAFLAAGAAMMTRLDASTPLPLVLAVYAVFGLGFSVVNPPITNTAVSGMPRTQAGVASALASTSRQVGASLGVALVGAVVGTAVRGPALVSASRPAFVLVAGAGVLVLVLGALTSGPWARRTALLVADRLHEQPA